MDELFDFFYEIDSLNSIESAITIPQAYVLGFSRALYHQDLLWTLNFFKKLNDFKANEHLRERAEWFILYKLYEGLYAEAESLLSQLSQPKSSKAVRRLISENDKPYYKEIRSYLKSISSKKLPEVEHISCPICLDDIEDPNSKPLVQCQHIFHDHCISRYITNKVDSRQFPILCPLELCKAEIDASDIKTRLEQYIFQQFEDYSFKNHVETHGSEYSCCPTADCPYIFIPNCAKRFKCPVCKKKYCLECRSIYHRKLNCEEFRAANGDIRDAEFLKFVKGAMYKQCILCQFWVERTKGCNHMTCRCGYEFCYKCGAKYKECRCGIWS
ncbi:unnamed protein product [Blepharisma stoltei]|uniref:RBR-type E3 ubiquitin transferase n=1 Tax=Blepharisma stoltei TaxID=1481888 RepID=A0AAU9KAB9_9CILI|nr:unnamed protein product [Blepharisma stoltei]